MNVTMLCMKVLQNQCSNDYCTCGCRCNIYWAPIDVGLFVGKPSSTDLELITMLSRDNGDCFVMITDCLISLF